MISTVSINKDAELADVTKMAKELLEVTTKKLGASEDLFFFLFFLPHVFL